MILLKSKWTTGIIFTLSIFAALGIMIFKYYYWQVLDDFETLPSYELWHIALLPFFVVSLLALIILLFNRRSIVAWLSLIICMMSGAVTYYVPYQVHYLDVYNAFYADGHEQEHNVNEIILHLNNADYDWLDAYLLAVHKRVIHSRNKELHLNSAYEKFAVPANSYIKQQLDAWVSKKQSYQAYTARAYYLASHAWQVRGHSYARDIPADNYVEMSALFKQSKSDLLRAVKIEPDNISAYCKLIEVYAVLGNKKNIEYALQHAININPYTYYARYYYMQYRLLPQWGGSKEEMYDYALSVRDITHGNPRLNALMTAYYENEAGLLKNDSKIDAAIRLYEKALGYAHYNSVHLTMAYVYKDQPDKSLPHYDSIIKKSPFHLNARTSRSLLLIKQDKAELALEDAKVVHEYANKNSFLTPVAWVFAATRNMEEAIDCYVRAIKYADDDAYALKQLVFIYQRRGETQKALDVALKMTKVSSIETLGNLLVADYMYDLNNEKAVEYINLFYKQLESGSVLEQSYIDSAIVLRQDIYQRFKVEGMDI